MNLEKQQEELQIEGKLVLKKLQLLELLGRSGKTVIVGSMALGLMTWRDIDIEVVVEKPDINQIAEIASNLIKKGPKRIDIDVTNNQNKSTPKTPKGIYLGLKYFGDNIKQEELLSTNKKAWKVDIHFVKSQDSQSIAQTEWLKKKLTDQKRRAILEIKKEVDQNPKYRKEIFSIDIYRAVLENGVIDLEGFKRYLKERNLEF